MCAYGSVVLFLYRCYIHHYWHTRIEKSELCSMFPPQQINYVDGIKKLHVEKEAVLEHCQLFICRPNDDPMAFWKVVYI